MRDITSSIATGEASSPSSRADQAPDPLEAPHASTAERVAAALTTDIELGLTPDDAQRRLSEHGPNELEARPSISLSAIVWDAVTEPFVILLAAAGVLAVLVGEVRDGMLVLVGLMPIVGADVVTEYRGERALAALREKAAPLARVRRAGQVEQVKATDVVAGDIVLIDAGDVIPADMRLTRANALLLDRSLLTGESVPETGLVEADDRGAALVDRRSVAYSGTSVVQGSGEGVVYATGARSELGRIAGSLGGEQRRRSPVQLELDRLVRILLVVAIGLIAITSGLALARGEPLGVALLAGVASAIAAIPEEPPVLLAVILGLGAFRLLRRNVLVRRLNAQETLSAVDLILTDKTGTLTRNELTLESALTPEAELAGERLSDVAELALRAEDDAWQLDHGNRAGSFTRSLERALAGQGKRATLDASDLIEAEPASGAHPYTRTLSMVGGSRLELVLGAPEVVLEVLEAGGFDRGAWQRLVDAHAAAGRRLLLLARGVDDAPARPEALLCFSDPLRDGVDEALRQAHEARIQTVVVTGDHPLTATRIADAAGLAAGRTVTGDEIAGWSDEELTRELGTLRVVARALPAQKLRLVEVARRARRTVAVTGDGVNDAPALERADVGVSMGSGTAVAREASDLVLGDDSFITLMGGLREGRRMVDNIEKGLVFLVSTHVALLGFILVATLYGISQPLLPLQILWIELFIDISASIAFEREPEDADILRRPPRARTKPLLDNGLLLRIAGAGTWTVLATLAVMVTYEGSLDQARWVAFNALVVAQVVRANSNRSLTRPLLTLRPNWVLLAVSVAVVAIQVAIPYVPVLAEIFHASPLSAYDWMLVAIVALVPPVVAEIVRTTRRSVWVA